MLLAAATALLASGSLAHAAPSSVSTQARQLDTGCERNGLPGSLAVCDGTGRLNVRLKGTAVLSVQGGRVTLKGKAARNCRLKRVKRRDGTRVTRRVCSKRPKPILPRGVETRKSRGYTIFIGERLYFYLPAGNWRVSARGRGLSLSAVGEGRAGVKADRIRDPGSLTVGLISVGGQLYNRWPRRWTKYDFGPDIPSRGSGDGAGDTPTTTQTTRNRSATVQAVVSTVPERDASKDDVVNLLKPAIKNEPTKDEAIKEEAAKALLAALAERTAANEAGALYSSDAQLPNDAG